MILHITHREAWNAALSAGAYRTDSLDTEGFIHCSTADQVIRVAGAFYRGQLDLVLLVIDEDLVGADVRWEAPAHQQGDAPLTVSDAEQFPHIYGQLNLDAVVRVVAFPPRADGRFELPSLA